MSDRERFVRLRAGRPIWAIAAVHGQLDRLSHLHEALSRRIELGDAVVYLGNYLGVGAQTLEVIEQILRMRVWLLARPFATGCDVAFLRGAQEEMWSKLLQLHFAPNPRDVLTWMMSRGVDATLTAYGGDPTAGLLAATEGPVALSRWTQNLRDAMAKRPGHTALMTGLRRAAFTQDQRLLFVHAGLDPARDLDRQGDSFWWATRGFDGLTEGYDPFSLVVRGFDPARRGVLRTKGTLSIDAGCGYGGPLVAVRLSPDGGELDRIEA
jgi:serine/threonine protein phosphatase 1